MIYMRGWAPDYDSLVAAGNPGWGWDDMLPAFRSMEDHALGASPLRGAGGPLHVSVPTNHDPVVVAMLEAATAAGLAPVDDVNASDDDRIGPPPSTIRRGVRVSSASAFLDPARRRPNLRVLAGARVNSVLLDSGRAARPDVQILLTPMSIDLAGDRLRLARHAGLMISGYQLRPTTHSAVHASGPNFADPPVIDAHYLDTDVDRRVTGRILERVRALLTQRPLADLVVAEESPGPDVATPEHAVEYALANGTGIYHAVGSCAMGSADEDVVDARLRVRGTHGLRIVDTSVFPAMPSGNTAGPTMALAWRAADLIREER